MTLRTRNRCDMKRKRQKKDFCGDYFLIYTDGSGDNLSETRFGATAFVVLNPKTEEILHQGTKCFKGVTNNQMELTSILHAVSVLPKDAKCEIRTDSRYCICVLEQMNREFPKNMDLINKFRDVVKRNNIKCRFTWVRGHNGDKWNEYVDNMANTTFMSMSQC